MPRDPFNANQPFYFHMRRTTTMSTERKRMSSLLIKIDNGSKLNDSLKTYTQQRKTFTHSRSKHKKLG